MLCILWLAIIYTKLAPCFEFLPGHYIPAIVFLQLLGSGLIMYYVNETLSKGYGLSGLTPVLIVAHRCKQIFWDALSPVAVDVGLGYEFEGAILNFVHLLWNWADKESAVFEAFFRKSQMNLWTLSLTFFVFFLMFFLKGW